MARSSDHPDAAIQDSDAYSFLLDAESDQSDYHWKSPPFSWDRKARALHFKKIIERRMGVNPNIIFHATVQYPFSYKNQLKDDPQIEELRKVSNEVDNLLSSSHTSSRGFDDTPPYMVQYSLQNDVGGGLRLLTRKLAAFVVKCVNIFIRFCLRTVFTVFNSIKWCLGIRFLSRRYLHSEKSVRLGSENLSYTSFSHSQAWGGKAPLVFDLPGDAFTTQDTFRKGKGKYEIIQLLGSLTPTQMVLHEKMYMDATVMDLVLEKLTIAVRAEIIPGVYIVRRQVSLKDIRINSTFHIQKCSVSDNKQLEDMVALLGLIRQCYLNEDGASDVHISSIGGPKGYYLIVAQDTEEIPTTSTCDCHDGWATRVKTLGIGNKIFCTHQRIRPCMSCQAISLESFNNSSSEHRTLATTGKRIVVTGDDLYKESEISSIDFQYRESNIPSVDHISTMLRHDDLIPSAKILRSKEIAVISVWRVMVVLILLGICMAIPGLTSLIAGDGFSLAAVLSGLLGAPAVGLTLLSLISIIKNGLRSEETAPVFMTRSTVTKHATLSVRDKEVLRSPASLFLAMFDEKAVFSQDDSAPYLLQSLRKRSNKKPRLFEKVRKVSECTKNMALVYMSNDKGQSIWLDSINMKVSAVRQQDGHIYLYGWGNDIKGMNSLQSGIRYEEGTQISSVRAEHEVNINVIEES